MRGGVGVTLWERKKERKKERRRSFKLRAQGSSRAAARGQVPTLLLLLHPSAPPQEGRKKKSLAPFSRNNNSFFLAEFGVCRSRSVIVVSPIRFLLACFVSVLESIFLGEILRFLEEAFLWGSIRRKDFSYSVCLLELRAFGIGFIACCLCFAVEIIAG
jgi:hypothetical protein